MTAARVPRPLLLLAILAGSACTASGAGESCRPPAGAESRYPFTGSWSAGRGVLCLYQQDYQSVIGTYAAATAAGIVQPDGELILSLAEPNGGVSVFSGRLRVDTLRLRLRIAAGQAPAGAAGTWIRTPRSANGVSAAGAGGPGSGSPPRP